MTSTAATVPPKLPVRRTVGACYAIVFRNLGQLLRISWLWLLILLPVYAGADWLASWAGPASEFIVILSHVIAAPFLASIAVAWHRLILRSERVTRVVYLRLDRVVWRYALFALAILLLIEALEYPLFFMARSLDSPRNLLISVSMFTLTVVVMTIATFFIAPRISLVLPAIAVGEQLSVLQAWRVTRANGDLLAAATLLCVLPWVVLGMSSEWWRDWLLDEASSDAMDQVVTWFGLAMALVGAASAIILAITLLSLTYRFFAARRDEKPTELSAEAGRP